MLDAGAVLDGGPLARGVWDITTSDATSDGGSADGGEPLPAPEVEPAILVRDGLVLIAYCNNAGHLSVDVGGSIRSIAGSSLVEVADVDLTGRPYDEGMSMRLRMPRLTGHGAARVPSQLWLSKQMSFPGELVSDESGKVWFEASRLWVPPGRFRIGGRFGDRGGWTRLDLEVGRRGDHQVLLR